MGEAAHTTSLGDDKAQTTQPVTWINCISSETGIVFINSIDIKLRNLGFDSCGSNVALNSDTGKLTKFSHINSALLFELSYNISIF